MIKIFLPNQNFLQIGGTPTNKKIKKIELISGNNIEQILEAKENLFITNSIDFIKENLFIKLKIIEAAGGLVFNEKKELLFIFRKGKWDLPKGKIEKNESIDEASIREVKEETGINNIKIIKDFFTTYHIYIDKWNNGKNSLKKTYWKIMNCNSSEKIKPQIEEDILEAKWFYIKNLKLIKNNTYPLILDLLTHLKND